MHIIIIIYLIFSTLWLSFCAVRNKNRFPIISWGALIFAPISWGSILYNKLHIKYGKLSSLTVAVTGSILHGTILSSFGTYLFHGVTSQVIAITMWLLVPIALLINQIVLRFKDPIQN